MIDLKNALAITNEYLNKENRDQEILKVMESSDLWIISCGRKGLRTVSGSPIAVNKTTGTISRFKLPNDKNFEILRSATPVDFESLL